MCGIAGWFCWGDKRPAPALVKSLLLVNQARGRDAAGVAYIDERDGELTVTKAPGPAEKLVRELPQDVWERVARSPRGLLHTRAQTKGTPANNENNHPVVGFGWVVTHNGSVQNDDSLFEYYKEKRPAEVDTIAIPLVLGKGQSGQRESLEDSLRGLTILGGSATFAAWSPQDLDTIILARLGYNDLYLFADQANKIMYWSSASAVEQIMPNLKLGSIRFNTMSKLADDRVVILNTDWGKCETYKVDRHPFFRHRTSSYGPSTTSTVGATKTGRWETWRKDIAQGAEEVEEGTDAVTETSPKTSITITDKELDRDFSWSQCRAEMVQLGKPRPVFKNIEPEWNYVYADERAFERSKDFAHTTKTCYGNWNFRREEHKESNVVVTIRSFQHHKRLRRFFHSLFGQDFRLWDELPAVIDAKTGTTALDFVFPREEVWVRYNVAARTERASMHGHVCPWCGAMMPQQLWIDSADRCRWCNVRSVAPYNYTTDRILKLMEKIDKKDKKEEQASEHHPDAV